jgi:GNAT superfamily N-acetyltransferase
MAETALSLRYATAADNVLLAELGAQTFRDTFGPDNTLEDMRAYLAGAFGPEKQAAELADPATIFLIVENRYLAVGYARLKAGDCPACIAGSRPIEIVRLYSRQDWIGRGVGPALMEACLAEARKQSCDRIWLDVWERNTRARAFYARWGFVEVGTQAFQLGGDLQNDILMQRAVRPR